MVADAPNWWLDETCPIGFNIDMAELLVVQTLTEKRAEVLGRIRAYEAQIAQAKPDLAHVNATIELFAAPERQRIRYMVSHGFFKRGRDRRYLHEPSRGGWHDEYTPTR